MARERLYQCRKCSHKWWEPVDDSHDVFCPNAACESYVNYAPKSRASSDNIGIVSKAAEITSSMLEEQYGIPRSMQVDNAREGDCYVKTPTPKATDARYLQSGPGSSEVIHNFLSHAAGSGGIGPSQNLSGMDVVNAAKKTGTIANPIKTSQFYSTRDE